MPKILFLGHGIAPFSIGGAVQYQWDLIEGARARGWETTAFFPAPRYSLSGKMRLKTWHRNGIKIIEIINSPYLPYHEVDPGGQCHHQDMQDLFRNLLDEEKPDVIHVHEIQMHPAAILDIPHEQGIPVLKTMHNYYDICPQHDLMFEGRSRCEDDDGGARCVACLTGRPGALMPFSQRMKRALTSTLPPAFFAPYHWLKRILRPNQKMSKVLFSAPPSKFQPTPEDYRHRRQFFLERLNRLDLIHCSSEGAADVFERHGVSRSIIRVVPLATKLSDDLTPRPLRGDAAPIIFGFMGGEQYHKGYQLLLSAMTRLDPERARLEIGNTAKTGVLEGHSNVQLKGVYSPGDLNEVLAGIDVGVVPSLWEESFGLVGTEFISARIPVIGARIGGIPQWLEEGINGLLFPPDDADELAGRMKRFTDDPGLVRMFQERMKPWKSFATHVSEMISIYEELIRKEARRC